MKHETKPRCLVTAGPTREFFDPVRFVSNPSSGRMGFALAEAALEAGWDVDLVHGPVALTIPDGVRAHPVVTAEAMFQACTPLFPRCHLLLMCAAVCDIKPVSVSPLKVKKDDLSLQVTFERTRDILKTLGERRNPGQILVGFAAETDNLESYARQKLRQKNLDWIVANSVSAGGAFEAADNTVTLLGKSGAALHFGPAPKLDVARWIIRQTTPSPCES